MAYYNTTRSKKKLGWKLENDIFDEFDNLICNLCHKL